MNKTPANSRYFFLSAVLMCGAFVLVFIPTAINRLVAIDEGFYLLAAKLVDTGRTPYLDFFYPQAPLFPYLLKLLSFPFDINWSTGRLVAGFSAVLIGLLLYLHIYLRHGKGFALLGGILFLSSHLVYGWYTIVKPYSVPLMLLFAAYFLIEHLKKKNISLILLTSGLLLGLSINSRLLMAVAAPVLLLGVIWKAQAVQAGSLKSTAFFLAGCLIATLPSLYLCTVDFDAFWLNNVGYHQLRSTAANSVFAWNSEKMTRLFAFIGLADAQGPYGSQFPWLFWISVLYVPLALYKRQSVFSLALAIALFIAHVLPPRVHLQYFCTVVPFLIIVLSDFGATLFALFKGSTVKLILRSFAVCFVCYYAFQGYDHYERYTKTGQLILSSSVTASLTVPQIKEVSALIDSYTTAGEMVYALWPGFLVTSHAKAISGMENNFGFRIADKFSKEVRASYKLLTLDEQREFLRSKQISIAVYAKDRLPSKDRRVLQKTGYKVIKETASAFIYRLPD
ncbi:glycosyltransferase family 39 protein [Oligoflexia bacterium]|nr:glycosyltransferase family 39 protein [Oligoflexia bacterium]